MFTLLWMFTNFMNTLTINKTFPKYSIVLNLRIRSESELLCHIRILRYPNLKYKKQHGKIHIHKNFKMQCISGKKRNTSKINVILNRLVTLDTIV